MGDRVMRGGACVLGLVAVAASASRAQADVCGNDDNALVGYGGGAICIH